MAPNSIVLVGEGSYTWTVTALYKTEESSEMFLISRGVTIKSFHRCCARAPSMQAASRHTPKCFHSGMLCPKNRELMISRCLH